MYRTPSIGCESMTFGSNCCLLSASIVYEEENKQEFRLNNTNEDINKFTLVV